MADYSLESLIHTVNELQSIHEVAGKEFFLELPQIVAIGLQSYGKSSVIEGIVGLDILPRGEDCVTKRPIILRLIYSPPNDKRRHNLPTTNDGDWAVFNRKQGPKLPITDFNQVRREIEDQMKAVTGISDEPIDLSIYSERLPNLTLVDLPGIVKNPIGKQDANIEEWTKAMVKTYISNPQSIILALSPANQDMQTTEALKIAREVDPKGERTLVVLTKLDLMNEGTDASKELKGKKVQNKLGIIGVVSRSQKDIDSKKSIEDTKWCRSLDQTLSRLLLQKIRQSLPTLREPINDLIVAKQNEFNSFGPAITNKREIILQMVERFEMAYKSTIEVTSRNIEVVQMAGGVRIVATLFQEFSKSLEQLEPTVDEKDILTSINNARGEQFFARTASPLNPVSLKFTNKDIQHDQYHYPMLYEHLKAILLKLLYDRLKPTNNFFHPDFAETLIAFLAIKEDSVDIQSKGIKKLIEKYFYIVRKSIQDQVPKVISFFLINHVRENLRNQLILKTENIGEELLNEEVITAEKNKLEEDLKSLKKAKEKISELTNSAEDKAQVSDTFSMESEELSDDEEEYLQAQ
uniref:Dynamin-like protein n=1 Tax=Ditylenchus dipsaci TaxID=166011 RepID=A0A915D9I8_9BILA